MTFRFLSISQGEALSTGWVTKPESPDTVRPVNTRGRRLLVSEYLMGLTFEKLCCCVCWQCHTSKYSACSTATMDPLLLNHKDCGSVGREQRKKETRLAKYCKTMENISKQPENISVNKGLLGAGGLSPIAWLGYPGGKRQWCNYFTWDWLCLLWVSVFDIVFVCASVCVCVCVCVCVRARARVCVFRVCLCEYC